jgi:hypothetical protein
MNKKTITVLIFFFFIIIFTIYNSKFPLNEEKKIVNKIFIKKCNAQKNICRVETNEFKMELSFDEKIYYLKPFFISVFTENKDNANVESVQIDFKMKNMDVGINRFMLNKTSVKNNKQVWQGKALLPICVTGRVDWVSELAVITKNNKYIISVPILVKRATN